MKLNELAYFLDRAPVILLSDPLSAAFLDDVQVIDDQYEFIKRMDSLQLQPSTRTVIIDAQASYHERLPRVALNHDPYRPELGNVLHEKYHDIMRWAFTQKDIAGRILSDTKVDTIILVLVDGLSYDDCKGRPLVMPCLVNGATITTVGFRNIIGDPSLAYRLFKKGFKSRLGFSYWDRGNDLTNMLFHGFDPQAQMHRVVEFEEIIGQLSKRRLTKTFVQIVLSGLDQFAHDNRDRPPIKEWVERLFSYCLTAIADVVRKQKLTGLLYMVSDHGIWWRPRPSEKPAIVVPDDKAKRKRLLAGHLIRNNVLHVTCYGDTYSLLRYPYVFRDFKRTEWGTHGGVSYYESVVPFLKMEVF